MIEVDIINYLETLEASLMKKERLLVSLIELTKEQESLLKKEDFDSEAFDEVMEKKGGFIEEISLLDEGFESIFSLIKKEVMENPRSFQRILEPMQAKIKSLIDKGVELGVAERRNQMMFETVLSKDRAKIKQFNMNSGAAAKYYSSMMKAGDSPNFFVDKKK